MKKILQYIKYIIISFISGITGIIPGMSGGTIFAIFNVSEDLVEAITKVLTFKWKNIKKHIALPIILGGGSLFSSIIYSKLFVNYINEYLLFFEFLFIGLIICSMPILLSETKEEQNKVKIAGFFVLGFILSLGIIYLSNLAGNNDKVNFNSPLYLIKYAIISIINGITMILPGISGTNVLLMFGEYGNYIRFTSHFNDYLLQNSVFLVSVVIGNVLSSYLLVYIFGHFRATFFAIISGMTFSTIFILYSSPFESPTSILQAIVGLILGGGLILLTTKLTQDKGV